MSVIRPPTHPAAVWAFPELLVGFYAILWKLWLALRLPP